MNQNEINTIVDDYHDNLIDIVDKLRPYYNIDKIKEYRVDVWNKTEDMMDSENIFDIHKDEIIFYTDDHTIIEEAKPIIKEIQTLLFKIANIRKQGGLNEKI